MNDAKSYVPPYAVGAVMDGFAVGDVIDSEVPELSVGDTVLHQAGWREYGIVKAAHAQLIDPVAPASAYLGVLGMPGLTAYVGLFDVAGMRAGDVVFVSGAAGAVGSLVGQLARLRGATRVVGSAGSPDKVAYLTGQLGFDAAFNYKDGPVAQQLAEAAPDGIDVYFDNVGGEHLEAAIGAARLHGRIAMCGAIAQYNAEQPPQAPRNLALMIGKRLSMTGFLVTDRAARTQQFRSEVGAWLAAGSIRYDETIVDGLENAPAAFIGMLKGENTGKMIVRVR